MTKRPAMPSVFVMTDETRLPDPVAVAQNLPPDWGLIFRHYEAPGRHQLAHVLSAVCKSRGLVLLIAGDWRLACETKADGVHMPEGQLRHETVSPLLNATRTRLLTTSAHGPTGIRLATALGADGVFLSPVKPTKSHAGAPPWGVFPFGAIARQSRVPVYALGGVTNSDAQRLHALGAAGIAGIRLVQENF
ncbi:MAG: thiamine phosphate synthase [Rhodospirillaceae bacterium]